MQLQIPQAIRVFLENLMRQAGTTPTDTAQAEHLLQELFQQLDAHIIDTVVDYLPVEKLDEFMAFIKRQPSREELDAYLARTLPNARDVYVVAFAGFRDNYLASVKTPHQFGGQHA